MGNERKKLRQEDIPRYAEIQRYILREVKRKIAWHETPVDR